MHGCQNEWFHYKKPAMNNAPLTNTFEFLILIKNKTTHPPSNCHRSLFRTICQTWSLVKWLHYIMLEFGRFFNQRLKTIWEKYSFIVPLAGTTTVLFKEKFQFHF